MMFNTLIGGSGGGVGGSYDANNSDGDGNGRNNNWLMYNTLES